MSPPVRGQYGMPVLQWMPMEYSPAWPVRTTNQCQDSQTARSGRQGTSCSKIRMERSHRQKKTRKSAGQNARERIYNAGNKPVPGKSVVSDCYHADACRPNQRAGMLFVSGLLQPVPDRAPVCQSHQPQTGQQHGIGIGFGNGRRGMRQAVHIHGQAYPFLFDECQCSRIGC